MDDDDGWISVYVPRHDDMHVFTRRYFLTYCDNPNFKRFLKTLKPIKRNPIERKRELTLMKEIAEIQREVDLVKSLKEIEIVSETEGKDAGSIGGGSPSTKASNNTVGKK